MVESDGLLCLDRHVQGNSPRAQGKGAAPRRHSGRGGKGLRFWAERKVELRTILLARFITAAPRGLNDTE
jgi:hypothetical protein